MNRLNRQEWLKLFPNYCRVCSGTGIHHMTDRVDYGSAAIGMDSTEPCVCTEIGCPRCGNPVIWDWAEDDFVPCTNCGWDYYSGDNQGLPDEQQTPPFEPDEDTARARVLKQVERVKEAARLTSSRIQHWHGDHIIANISLDEARQLVVDGSCFVITKSAIGVVYTGGSNG